ncbi:hypothetical protein [Methylobacter sp. YRD-M1]|uniref:hypothetical protein n=1 Tax=Methylobacter sp. YRD-M1 TaxID=2911520 RepID=UPI00227BED80|nr:hypothetical protein [Methylobacter sp. YRD-M1]WAK03863.1 hypothetical protein LZ558_08785 [Methylobacter sp. YRD-M1]
MSSSWSAASGIAFSIPGTEGCMQGSIEFLYNYHIQRFNNHKVTIKKSINLFCTGLPQWRKAGATVLRSSIKAERYRINGSHIGGL